MLETDKRYSATEKMKSINSLKKLKQQVTNLIYLRKHLLVIKISKEIGMQIIGV